MRPHRLSQFGSVDELRFEPAKVVYPDGASDGCLAARGIRLLLVEGGSTVIGSFLQRGLADELKVFVASEVLGGHSAPTLVGSRNATPAEDAVRLRLDRAAPLGDGVLLEYAVVRR